MSPAVWMREFLPQRKVKEPNTVSLGAYRDVQEGLFARRRALVRLRREEATALPPAFFAAYHRRVSRRVAGGLALFGVLLVPLCYLFALRLAPWLCFVWLAIAFAGLSRRVSQKILHRRLEELLSTSNDLFGDLPRLEQPITKTLLQSGTGRLGVAVPISSLTLLAVLSVTSMAPALPGFPVFAFILSLFLGVRLLHLPEAKEGSSDTKNIVKLLGWIVCAWIPPGIVLALSCVGAPTVGVFLVALCFGVLIAKQFIKQAAEEELLLLGES